jgi:glycerol-3-phosphate acyltransferase PlsX
MGDGFARIVLGQAAPSIGLLNVASEPEKGDDRLLRAAEILRASALGAQFAGFVEGHDIIGGKTDIVVTDGFTGNVAMKMGEGALRFSGALLRQALTGGVAARLAAFLMRPSLKRLRQRIDPWQYNGAVMLGLNGVVVKSRGSTDGAGFSRAVAVGLNMVGNDFNDRIREAVSNNVLF